MSIAKAVAAALALASSQPAWAAEVRDAASGLVIDAPAGYTAEKIDGGARYAASYTVRKDGASEAGCRVGFQAAPQNASLSQQEINAFTAKPEWNDLIKATLALYYDVISVEPFEQSGLTGAAVVGDPKPVEDESAEEEPATPDGRSYFVLIDTPKGRTTVVCIGSLAEFDARKTEFEAVARAVQPPR